jgi:hypothetical protein
VWAAARSLWCWWATRHLPGTWGLPLLGHLPHLSARDISEVFDEWARLPGNRAGAFQAWLGGRLIVVITDLATARRVMMRTLDRSSLHATTIKFGQERAIWGSGLLMAHGPPWRRARRAFEAAVMHPAALRAQAPLMAKPMGQLVSRLDRYAGSGEPVDVLPLVYALTMDAVGYAAFGVDLHATAEDGPNGVGSYSAAAASAGGGGAGKGNAGWWVQHPVGSVEFGRQLVDVAVSVMKSMAVTEASAYTLMVRMFTGVVSSTCLALFSSSCIMQSADLVKTAPWYEMHMPPRHHLHPHSSCCSPSLTR